MIRRLFAAACCLAVVGCSAVAPEPFEPVPSPNAEVTVRGDGVLMESLGYSFAPQGFSLPASSVIIEGVNQENTVVAVFSEPEGDVVAAYLRETLPGDGWRITADANDSLLFERGDEQGAFTVNEESTALAIRWDARS